MGIVENPRLSWRLPTDRRLRGDLVKKKALIVCAVLAVSGCATFSGGRRADDFCGEMAKFANATARGSQREVVLLTNWAEWSKTCQHDGYEPGMRFCEWLIDNTSTEFAEFNIRRALNCLDPGMNYAGGGRVSLSYLTGKVESSYAKGADEDVRVTVEYADGIEGQCPKLKIAAERWVPDE